MDLEKPPDFRYWLTTVDHVDIGKLYLVFATLTGLLGALDGMMLRTALLTPEANIWWEMTYNALFTTHGLTMLFLFATPAAFGLGNILIPLLIGADDMAFPRINALAFWLLPFSAILIRIGIIPSLLGLEGLWRPPMTGWTLYPPLSLAKNNVAVDVVLLGLHLSGLSTIMAAINFIVTVIEERTVSWADLDIFTWTIFTTSGIVLFAFPVLGSSLLMLLADRNFGTTFFLVEGGGPILWQHLFWFFGHPEVYILVLPAMGILSFIIPRFSGRALFGFEYVVYSTLAIGVLSFGVWAHHMFTTGIDPRLQASFMAVSIAIAVPSAVKTFNWITTMWNGRVRLTAPMLFSVGAVANFIIGGVTGVFLAAIPVDEYYHGTYYVVGHFHLVIVGTIVCAFFAACYYWFPLLTGRKYHPGLARIHFWLTVVGTVGTFGALLLLGQLGLPRRMATYPIRFAPIQQFATVFAYVMGFGQLIWVWNMLRSTLRGTHVRDGDVWDLAGTGLLTDEWEWLRERVED